MLTFIVFCILLILAVKNIEIVIVLSSVVLLVIYYVVLVGAFILVVGFVGAQVGLW